MRAFLRTVYEQVPDQYGRVAFWGLLALPLLPAGLVAWLASRLDWFWANLGWFGVAAVILIVWMIIGVGLAEYQRWAEHNERRQRNAANKNILSSIPTESDPGVYEGAHEKLLLFVVRELLPTCEARQELHDWLIRAFCFNGLIADLARAGARTSGNAIEFLQGMQILSRLKMSPPEFIPFAEMIEAVSLAERGYQKLLVEGNRLASSGFVTKRVVANKDRLWEQWQLKHNAMIVAYDDIKQDSRMGKLFRPARMSGFGWVLEAPSTDAHPLSLLIQDIEAKTQR